MTFKKIISTLAVGSTLMLLTACSSSPKDEVVIANRGAQVLYEGAKRSLTNGNFAQAANTLSALDSRYPFGPLSHQIQLDLIYAHYKSGDIDKTLATIDRFIRLNPNHSDADYAYYMRGLTNMEADSNLFQDLFNIDRADRDPSNSRQAFTDFRNLLEKYPDSKYSADAQKRMLYLKNRLADYEIAIARFYMRRQAYVAAANRGRYVVEYYPDSSRVQEALEIMVECYDQLNLNELKAHAMQTLKLNFPNNDIAG